MPRDARHPDRCFNYAERTGRWLSLLQPPVSLANDGRNATLKSLGECPTAPDRDTDMTPAVKACEEAGISHEVIEYTHDSKTDSYGEEAARVLDQPPSQVFKTLVTKLDGRQLAVAIVPVAAQLDLKAMATSQKAKKAVMAGHGEAQRATGYVLGGISPLGQKRRLPTTIDGTALGFEHIFVSGGKRGLELRLDPRDLAKLCGASFAAIGKP